MECDEPAHPGERETPQVDRRDEQDDYEDDHRDDREVQFRMRPNMPPPNMGLMHAMVGRPVNLKPEPFDGKGDWSDYIVYFEQLAELNGWDKPTMAILLGLSLQDQARSVLASLSLPQRRDYDALKTALTQNFCPPQQVHLHMAELKARKRKPQESLSDLSRDIARLTRLAYPNADMATRETIAINAFLDSFPGPAIEMRLHVIKGHPTTLQEAVAYALEVDALLETHGTHSKRSNVRSVEEASEAPKTELQMLAEAFKKLERKVEEMTRHKNRSSVKCFNCGRPGHMIKDCRLPKRSGNDRGQPGPRKD